jgi:hypothetical protein
MKAEDELDTWLEHLAASTGKYNEKKRRNESLTAI